MGAAVLVDGDPVRELGPEGEGAQDLVVARDPAAHGLAEEDRGVGDGGVEVGGREEGRAGLVALLVPQADGLEGLRDDRVLGLLGSSGEEG